MTAVKKSYIDLAKEAIASIKDRTGSSAQAIKAYITSKYPSFKFQQVSVFVVFNNVFLFLSTYSLSVSEFKFKL